MLVSVTNVTAVAGHPVCRYLETELLAEPRATSVGDRHRPSAGKPPPEAVREERIAERCAEGAGQVRSPLAPIEAAAGEGPPLRPDRLEVDAEIGDEPGRAGSREQEGAVAAPQQAAGDQGVRDGDAEQTGEMVVAGASAPQRPRRLRGTQPGRRARGRDARERLERVGQLRTREAEEAMAAGSLLDDQPALAQLAQVRTRAGTRDAGSARELPPPSLSGHRGGSSASPPGHRRRARPLQLRYPGRACADRT